ncbi:uncharacterized protein [Clytia hemisphaerica]|uniref:Tyrosinase copper-binding domain-containing protein n=1 Tax=Clytia hemisphaerica TaxID=252671 RepID=A0A7M5XIS8_9CNID
MNNQSKSDEEKIIRKRMAIRDLEEDKHRKRRYAFLKAFHVIKNLPPENEDSYWKIASFNGQPFTHPRTTPPESLKMWGADSQHQNVLFLPWYRAYLLHLEEALVRNAPEDGDLVALHYWDETWKEIIKKGEPPLPNLLVKEFVEIDDDGTTISNPLLGFTLPKAIPLSQATSKYVKPAGYTTCRYPYSGLRKPENPLQETFNAKIQNDYVNHNLPKSPTFYLQENITHALKHSIHKSYKDCLEVEKYNKFSNIQSGNHSVELASIQMLQALGGTGEFSLIAGSHGDLGSNEMAAFDPLFFLHMSNVDRVFWLWYEKWAHNVDMGMSKPDKGEQPKYGQGPSPNQTGNEVLTADTNLYPFKKAGKYLNRNELMDIKELGYHYERGSMTLPDPPHD